MHINVYDYLFNFEVLKISEAYDWLKWSVKGVHYSLSSLWNVRLILNELRILKIVITGLLGLMINLSHVQVSQLVLLLFFFLAVTPISEDQMFLNLLLSNRGFRPLVEFRSSKHAFDLLSFGDVKVVDLFSVSFQIWLADVHFIAELACPVVKLVVINLNIVIHVLGGINTFYILVTKYILEWRQLRVGLRWARTRYCGEWQFWLLRDWVLWFFINCTVDTFTFNFLVDRPQYRPGV